MHTAALGQDDDLLAVKLDVTDPADAEAAAYAEEDVLGKPHSIIRHPDMPRCVFKLLWDTIAAGDEIFAYVLNLAGDCAHYWVFAHVTPSFDAAGRIVGYHSNRRSPDRAAVREVAAVYATLLAEEGRHAQPKKAMQASGILLEQAARCTRAELRGVRVGRDRSSAGGRRMARSWQRRVGRDVEPSANDQPARGDVEAALAVGCRVAAGDLEARVPRVEGPSKVQDMRRGINDLVDVADAFVREATASLTAASKGRYYRQFLVRGMPGPFATGAATINAARASMRSTAERLAEQEARGRVHLTDTVSTWPLRSRQRRPS